MKLINSTGKTVNVDVFNQLNGSNNGAVTRADLDKLNTQKSALSEAGKQYLSANFDRIAGADGKISLTEWKQFKQNGLGDGLFVDNAAFFNKGLPNTITTIPSVAESQPTQAPTPSTTESPANTGIASTAEGPEPKKDPVNTTQESPTNNGAIVTEGVNNDTAQQVNPWDIFYKDMFLFNGKLNPVYANAWNNNAWGSNWAMPASQSPTAQQQPSSLLDFQLLNWQVPVGGQTSSAFNGISDLLAIQSQFAFMNPPPGQPVSSGLSQLLGLQSSFQGQSNDFTSLVKEANPNMGFISTVSSSMRDLLNIDAFIPPGRKKSEFVV